MSLDQRIDKAVPEIRRVGRRYHAQSMDKKDRAKVAQYIRWIAGGDPGDSLLTLVPPSPGTRTRPRLDAANALKHVRKAHALLRRCTGRSIDEDRAHLKHIARNLEQYIREHRRRAPPKAREGKMRKDLSVAYADDLLRWWGHVPTTTSGGSFHYLSKILFEAATGKLGDTLRAVKRFKNEGLKSVGVLKIIAS